MESLKRKVVVNANLEESLYQLISSSQHRLATDASVFAPHYWIECATSWFIFVLCNWTEDVARYHFVLYPDSGRGVANPYSIKVHLSFSGLNWKSKALLTFPCWCPFMTRATRESVCLCVCAGLNSGSLLVITPETNEATGRDVREQPLRRELWCLWQTSAKPSSLWKLQKQKQQGVEL